MGTARNWKIVLLSYECVARSVVRSLESPLTITRRENRQRPYRHLSVKQSSIHHLVTMDQTRDTCVLNPPRPRNRVRVLFRRYSMKTLVSYGELHLPVVSQVAQWKAPNYSPCYHPQRLKQTCTFGAPIGLSGNKWKVFFQIFSEDHSLGKQIEVSLLLMQSTKHFPLPARYFLPDLTDVVKHYSDHLDTLHW